MTPPRPLGAAHPIEHLEDFTQHSWCNALLSHPSISKISTRTSPENNSADSPGISNSFFARTLFTDDAVRAFLSLYRPGRGRSAGIADAEVASDALLGADKATPDNTLRNTPRDEGKEKPDTQAALDEPEALILVSLGSGIDGATHRLHGGVTATLLDQVMGVLISFTHENTSATAELNVKYKKVITTPCVVLCRARIVREAGRWIETVGSVEDGEGVVFAEGRGSFVKSKVVKL
jgi:acyl-coenzyme A thioesterase PaaI-like protein